ncbi:MAG: META domain-containing protein [Synergistaceae bacterium]|jgi:heat shock protein HslJ|nr:META domain-containing protein [Synergistaceae bacterium]
MTGKFFKAAMLAAVILAILEVGALADTSSATDELFFYKNGRMYVLNRARSSSGERYEATGDPSTCFSSNGGYSVFAIEGLEQTRYVLLRDSLGEGGLILTADGKNYAMRQVVSASGAKYEALDDPATVFWSKGPAAMLSIEGNDYSDYEAWMERGGIWLPDQDLPAEVEWRAKSIGGSDVIDGSNVTVTFHSDGRISGNASVNSYNVAWLKHGSRIIIGRGVTTRMGGRPELMKQEDEFLDLLSHVSRFRIQRNELTLIARNGAEIILTKQRCR